MAALRDSASPELSVNEEMAGSEWWWRPACRQDSGYAGGHWSLVGSGSLAGKRSVLQCSGLSRRALNGRMEAMLQTQEACIMQDKMSQAGLS